LILEVVRSVDMDETLRQQLPDGLIDLRGLPW